ncbi:MAG: Zn-ribbon domain-containing OB-fold protein [Solirubrobacteraceae bacterium]
MSELLIWRCEACGAGLFPERLRCARCGGLRLVAAAAGPGAVEQETVLPRSPDRQQPGPIRLGSVRLAAGPVVIARLGEGVRAGAGVRLSRDAGGAVWAALPPEGHEHEVQ